MTQSCGTCIVYTAKYIRVEHIVFDYSMIINVSYVYTFNGNWTEYYNTKIRKCLFWLARHSVYKYIY